jgi:hypothetical protein
VDLLCVPHSLGFPCALDLPDNLLCLYASPHGYCRISKHRNNIVADIIDSRYYRNPLFCLDVGLTELRRLQESNSLVGIHADG